MEEEMVIFREQISLHVHISIQDGIIFIPHLTENKHLKNIPIKTRLLQSSGICGDTGARAAGN